MASRRRRLNRALIVKDTRTNNFRLVKTKDDRGSKQIKERLDSLYSESGIIRPPYEFEQLTGLLIANTAHYRAVKQKASDVAGRGWELRPMEGVEAESPQAVAERQRITESLNELTGKQTMREVLESVAFDYEAVGWGFLELVLDGKGDLQEIHHLPGHTMRAHRDGNKYAQVRDGKVVWFIDADYADPFAESTADKRFINAETGEITEESPGDDVEGNPVIPFIHYTPLSSWYGLPDFIPSVGAMASNKAITEFNIGHITNNTVPQYAVVVQGAELSEELEEDIVAYFRDHVQGQQRATLVLPIPYAEGEVEVKFERLASDVGDGGFLNLRDANTVEVLMAHGVPPYRVAWAVMGTLGGNLGREMNEVYKDAIVEARQDVIEDRFNKYVIRQALGATLHEWRLADIDLTDRRGELELGVRAVEFGIMTPAEVRTDIMGKDAGNAPDTFYMSGTLRPVDDPTPTEEEMEAAAFKSLRREARGDLIELRSEVREALEQYRSMLRERGQRD